MTIQYQITRAAATDREIVRRVTMLPGRGYYASSASPDEAMKTSRPARMPPRQLWRHRSLGLDILLVDGR